MKVLIVLVLVSIALKAEASAVAMVKMLRGHVEVKLGGESKELKLNDTLDVGAVIKTSAKSFARINLADNSTLNVGPESEIVIESFTNKESGVISVIQGKLRSKVSKDYMDIKEKDKSKLFIKSPMALLGVRGTDFLVSVSMGATSTVLFEGEIVFNRFEGGFKSMADLEAMVDRGVHIRPGEFSVVDNQHELPTVPASLNVNQLEKLERNDSFSLERGPSSTQGTVGSLVPPGLSGNLAANTQESVKSISVQVTMNAPVINSVSKGFVDGNLIRPANGSFLHLESGVVIPPSSNSIFDSASNTYIGGTTNGVVGEDGSFHPPKGMDIAPDGTISVTSVTSSGQTIKTVIQAPPPVVVSVNTGSIASVLPPPPAPVFDPALSQPPPSGGLQGVNDPQRATDTYTNVTLRY